MKIINDDCLNALNDVPNHSVDLIMMDPPYEFDTHGGGAFGNDHREYRKTLSSISKGITNEVLDLICQKMKKINIYISGVTKRSFASTLTTSTIGNAIWTC